MKHLGTLELSRFPLINGLLQETMHQEEKHTKLSEAELSGLLPTARIIAMLGDLGINVASSFAKQVQDYTTLLLRWNRKVSLTSVREPEQILIRHFAESLFGALAAGIESGNLLDVGSGAGFPALPIAMFSKGIRETLLEPNIKKAAFLAEVCRTVDLVGRVTILRTRLEAYSAHEASFDFVTSRAVRVSPPFLQRCRRFLRSRGRLVLWLGQEDLEAVMRNENWIWGDPAKILGSERRFVLWGEVSR